MRYDDTLLFISCRDYRFLFQNNLNCSSILEAGASLRSHEFSTTFINSVELSACVCLQSAIPAKALKKDWTDQQRKAWAASLKSASEPVQVLQVYISHIYSF